jgi:hypothetical protein
MTPYEWSMYQKGMRDMSATIAEQVGKKLKLPHGAERMLDVGGAHGLYSRGAPQEAPEAHEHDPRAAGGHRTGLPDRRSSKASAIA